MFTSLFWKDLAERALSTAAQVLIAVFAADQFSLLNADWAGIGESVGIAVVLVVLKSLVAGQVVSTVSPASLAKDKRGV